MTRSSLWGAVLALLAACTAIAQPPDHANFLNANGYPPEQFAITAQWEERVDDRLITGYALTPVAGGDLIERYRDGDHLLSDTERDALGIAPKHWAETTANAPAERNVPGSAESPRAMPVGSKLKSQVETLALAPYTPEDFALINGGAKPDNQIGDFRDFMVPVSLAGGAARVGTWIPLAAGGFLWQLSILSPAATGQRLHVAQYALPAGARLTVYNPAAIQEAFSTEGTGADLWLPSVFNETVAVEVFAPDAIARDAISVNLDRTVHLYAPRTIFEKAAGACNLNVPCYPDWADTALGVCGLGSIGNSGALFCTGTLLADTNPCAVTPYVLTANHCIGGPGSANSLEFYWFYQSNGCPGTVPALISVPRTTGGADYLAGSGGTAETPGGNDFTLLRMRNDPPNGTTYVGWSAATPAIGTAVTDIHHPRGDYKRITFGNLANQANPFSIDYHEVRWTSGTTEPGSSGSPLFLTASQQIIGQLWGGDASCAQPTAPDFFGRFSRSYPIVQSQVDSGPTEAGYAFAEFQASEADATATITVTLSHPAGSGGHSVAFAVAPGTAVSGEDFTPVSGTLNYPADEDTATFTIPLLQDTHRDDGKTILLTLSTPSCGGLSASLGNATLILNDDDPDADGDGIADQDEILGTYGPPTNPALADSDGDRLNDYDELFGTLGYVTDPNLADTDGDGTDDLQEITLGSDPLIANPEDISSLTIPMFRS